MATLASHPHPATPHASSSLIESLTPVAFQMLRERCAHASRWRRMAHDPASPVCMLLPQLIQLILSDPHRPADQWAPCVRKCLGEVEFHDESAEHHPESMEARVRLVLDVMEALRQHGLRQGLWSSQRCSDPMFG